MRFLVIKKRYLAHKDIFLYVFISLLGLMMVLFHIETFEGFVLRFLAYEKKWDFLMAVFTFIAAIVALLALLQSLKISKRSSFDLRFTQLVESLRNAVLDPKLSERIEIYLRQGESLDTRQELDVLMQGFWEYTELRESLSGSINACTFTSFCKGFMDKNALDRELNARCMFDFWDTFCSRLVYRSDFLRCFTILYNIIIYVDKYDIGQETKDTYMKIIRSNLTKDFLFCYMINLMRFNEGMDRDYLKILRKYDFFCDVLNDDIYGNMTKRLIPSYLYQHFRNTPE